MSLYIIMQNGQTPLHLAAANNHTSVVEKLINFRAPVNSVEEVNIYCKKLTIWVCVDTVVVAVYIDNWQTCKME